MMFLLLPLSTAVVASPVSAFAPIQVSRSTSVHLFAEETATETSTLALSLPKPLGLILEEVEEGSANGVFVQEVSDSGSAVGYASQLNNAKLATVQGQDVTGVDFDTAMNAIINAPATVDLTFLLPDPAKEASGFAVGDIVSVVAQQEGQTDLTITAKVGDNLRKTLLDNGFEVYQGLSQKLGNCGGGGQCTFCAMDFVESQGWEERSDYENQKLAKFPDARLSCLNSIQGPVTLRKTMR